jgi:hypothetical protein
MHRKGFFPRDLVVHEITAMTRVHVVRHAYCVYVTGLQRNDRLEHRNYYCGGHRDYMNYTKPSASSEFHVLKTEFSFHGCLVCTDRPKTQNVSFLLVIICLVLLVPRFSDSRLGSEYLVEYVH